MWKVFLAFVVHRGLLLLVALLTLQMTGAGKGGDVSRRFFDRVAQGPEAHIVEELGHDSVGQVISKSRNPFHWVCAAMKSVTGMRPVICLLILSNLFLLLFLFVLAFVCFFVCSFILHSSPITLRICFLGFVAFAHLAPVM